MAESAARLRENLGPLAGRQRARRARDPRARGSAARPARYRRLAPWAHRPQGAPAPARRYPFRARSWAIGSARPADTARLRRTVRAIGRGPRPGMTDFERRRVGRTDTEVSVLGFGGATLGGLAERVPEDQAQATLEAAWDEGVRYFDTAPFYGLGLSELRVGRQLRERPRSEFVLSTKVGRILRAPADLERPRTKSWPGGLRFEVKFDYTYDGILRAYEDSLQRLGLMRID